MSKEDVLPLSQQQCYAAFKRVVEQTSQLAAAAEVDSAALKPKVAALQQLFRSQILSLPKDELPLTLQHRVQLYQVEIDKQLRLLGMDVLFLQSARQAVTLEQRCGQIRDRLHTLRRYCEALLEQDEAAEGKETEG